VKILYAIQATGNGHLVRAREIVPILQKLGETDVIVSGIQGDISLPFEIRGSFYGFSFIFGKKGGIDFLRTLFNLKLIRLFRDIILFPVKDYDLIINDFEPVTAWACKIRKKECIGLSHQNAVLHPSAAKPPGNGIFGKLVLKYYAPVDFRYGFHFEAFNEMNFTPVIRKSIREVSPKNKGHFTVYLSAFSDREIIKLLEPFQRVSWEVFSKSCTSEYQIGNIYFSPVSYEAFNESFVNCAGIFCTAGFETPAEAIHMGKKLCVIPMKNQYEQACNAAQLAKMGIMVIENNREIQSKIGEWISSNSILHIEYNDTTSEIIHELVRTHALNCENLLLNNLAF